MNDKYKIIKKITSIGVFYDVYYLNGLCESKGWKHMNRFHKKEMAKVCVEMLKEEKQ